MTYQGDFTEDSTHYFLFPTRTSTGAAITLAGTPVLECFKDDNTTETLTGLTLGVDYDGKTGSHLVTIDTSADAFYVTGSDYTIKLNAGTVDSVDVTHETLATFSIENREIADVSALATSAALATVDTNVDAIQAKTDDLTFTNANELDANIKSVNDTSVIGDGQAGTEWGS